MISVETAIHRVRRDITLGVLLKAALIAGAVACMIFAPAYARIGAVFVVAAIWIALNVTSARSSRLALDSPVLIAAGRFEEAEQRIDQAMRAFSMFRSAKLQSLQHLAVLRHAQRRWQESAALSRAILSQRMRGAEGLSRAARLLLAEAMLEMNDPAGAHQAIAGLYQERLSLGEVLTLLGIQLDYESRVGAWEQMMNGAQNKVQLIELMPTSQAARSQALLAVAAMKTGRQDWADWLRQRAETLFDATRLAAERPGLWELWKKPG